MRITGLQEQAHNAAKLAAAAIREGRLEDADRWLTDARSNLQGLRRVNNERRVAEVLETEGAKTSPKKET